jgi:ATP-binding cassette subfamily B protein
MTLAEFVLPRAFSSNRTSSSRWILSHVQRHWWLVVVMFVGAFGNASLAALVPVLIGRAFNTILADPNDIPSLLNIALWIVISQIVRSVLQWGRNFGAELIGQRLERDIREELYLELLGKSMTFHNLLPVGDTMARATNDVREINLMFSPGFNLVVGSANFLLLPLILAPSYHPSLILVPAVFILAYALSLVQYLRELRPITTDARESFGVMNARLSEAIDGIEVVKGHAREEDEILRFSNNVRAFRNAFVRQGDVEARFVPLLLMGLSIGVGFAHALLLFRQGLLDVGQVIAYVGLLQLFGFPTFVSLFAYSQVSLGLAGARRILEVINRETDLDQNPSGYHGMIKGKVTFRDLSFAYPSSDLCLEGVNLEIEPGQTVAVVGQTGSGKTTLIKLINRTYDVTSGELES